MRRDLVKMWGNRTDSQGKSALFRVDKRVYPGCYVENLSTMIVENLVETVEKPIIKHLFNTFHRVFNMWKSALRSTLCINCDAATRQKMGLHF